MTEKATEQKSLENIEAEAALLGGLLIDNSFVDRVSEFLTQEDFVEAVHGRIFRAILRMRAHGENANPITLKPMFEDDEDLADYGGAGYLAKLTGSGSGVIGIIDFAKQVGELSRLRKAQAALQDALASIEVRGEMPNIGVIQGELETKLWAARDRVESAAFRSPEEMVSSARVRAESSSKNQAVVGAKNAFISDLNVALGPLEGGTYNIVAGRPSMGKTVLGVSALLGYAANGHPGTYLHQEMMADQMDMRVASDLAFAMHADITHDQIKKGELDERQLRKLDDVREKARSLPFNFVATGRCDVARINSLVARSCAMWEAKNRKLEVVVVDYLQLLSAESVLGNRNVDPRSVVNAVSDQLLKIAQRYGVALIALSQLSRKVEDRPGGVPQMADLRESGRLEEDADSVTLLHRPEYYMERETPPTKPKEKEEWDIDLAACRGQVDLIVTKNRHGSVMKRPAKFFGKNYAIRGGDFGAYDPMFNPNQAPLI